MTTPICTNCHRPNHTEGPLCQRCVSAGVVPPLMVPANSYETPTVVVPGVWSVTFVQPIGEDEVRA